MDDNKQFYGILEEDTRSTTYKDSIEPFYRASNGPGDYLAMIAQHVGKGKWIIILRGAKYFINNQRCYWTTTTRLRSHIEQCLESYVEW